MGTFLVPLRIRSADGARTASVGALVDTGATHTVLPRELAASLGLQPVDRVAFTLADEREVEYEVGEARVRLDGRERTVLVVFGPEGASPLLGATTLELFNLAADPVRKRLVPVPGLLKRAVQRCLWA